jgi:hypothetical protein
MSIVPIAITEAVPKQIVMFICNITK